MKNDKCIHIKTTAQCRQCYPNSLDLLCKSKNFMRDVQLNCVPFNMISRQHCFFLGVNLTLSLAPLLNTVHVMRARIFTKCLVNRQHQMMTILQRINVQTIICCQRALRPPPQDNIIKHILLVVHLVSPSRQNTTVGHWHCFNVQH